MIELLIEQIKKKNAPIVVGLDPTLSIVPKEVLDRRIAQMGETLEAAAQAVWDFNRSIIDAIYDLIPAVKPQIAMYEQFGVPGLAVFHKTVTYCKQKGLLVIGDVKRGDIGSTSEAYAQAHLGTITIGHTSHQPFGEDFATVNPYLGSDGIRPFLKVCKEANKGIFILVKTSNPSSGELQDRLVDGKPLYEHLARMVDAWGQELMHDAYSDVGAVVGATYPEVGQSLRKLMPKAYILVPGYGAQGAAAKELGPFFNRDGLGAIINSSRGILAAYQDPRYASYGEAGYADAARAAVLAMRADIETAIR
ncbi:MAG: orotidine-5'-phosphate decarboxylase [Clostridium sp.]|nr:orotidine-5'-phosphate decarboxylase [Clostridium sp.]